MHDVHFGIRRAPRQHGDDSYGPRCSDHLGAISGSTWSDSRNGCAEYAANINWCEFYGRYNYNGEGTAKWACCACGGGVIAPGDPTPSPTGCVDHLGATSGNAWSDGWNVCDAYAANTGWCDSYGIHDYSGEGTAIWACCACGGGWHATDSPTPSPILSPTSRPTPSPTLSPTSSPTPSLTPTPAALTPAVQAPVPTGSPTASPTPPPIQSTFDAMPLAMPVQTSSAGLEPVSGAMASPMSTPAPMSGSMSSSTQSTVVAAAGDPHMQNVHGERFDLMKEGRSVLLNIPRGERAGNTLLRVVADARRLGGACAGLYFSSINVTGAWSEKQRRGGYSYAARTIVKKPPKWLIFGHRHGFGCAIKVVYGRTQGGLVYLNFYVRHLGRAGFVVGGLLGEDDHSYVATPSAACLQRMALHSQSEVNRNGSDERSVASASFT
ncbi:unnamed protein product [Prorocentrum cordatum]|nr:unnamed protein product [Polarella glacialis]